MSKVVVLGIALGLVIFGAWGQTTLEPINVEQNGEGQGEGVNGSEDAATTLSPLVVDSVSFMLYARDLATGYDYFNSEPDPYVIWSKNSGVNGTWIKLLETQQVLDTRRPSWNEVFVDPDAKLNAGQEWRFDVYDFDPIGPDDYMGSVTMPVDEFLRLNTTFLPKKIQPSLNPTSGYLIFYKPVKKV